MPLGYTPGGLAVEKRVGLGNGKFSVKPGSHARNIVCRDLYQPDAEHQRSQAGVDWRLLHFVVNHGIH